MRQYTPVLERRWTAASTFAGGIGLLAGSLLLDHEARVALTRAGWVLFFVGCMLTLFQLLLQHDRNYSRGHRDGTRLRGRVDSHLSVVPDDRHRAHR